jgi:hypothetical protein
MKNSLFLILLGVVVLLVILFQIKSCHDKNYYSNILLLKNDTIKQWKDEAGRWHAEAVASELSKDEMKTFFSKEVSELQKDFNIKLKDVTAYLKASIQSDKDITMAVDSGSMISVTNLNGSDTAVFHFNDAWSTINASLYNNKLHLIQQSYDSISFVTSIKRSWLFGPRTTVLNGISYNPSSKISGITGIEIKVPSRRFGIGPYVGYGFNGKSWGMNAGVSIHYSVVKF